MKTIFFSFYIFLFLPTIYCAQKYPTRRWLQICNASNNISKYVNKTTTSMITFLKENREDLYL